MTRMWTPEEDEVLKRLYGKISTSEIAHKISRGVPAVYTRAKVIGVKSSRLVTDFEKEKIRQLNEAGFSDMDIGKAIGRNPHVARLHRRRMGLPDRRHNERHKQKQREGALRRMDRDPKSIGGHLHQIAAARMAARSGWPKSLRRREVQILNLLAAVGVPVTRYELADMLNYNHRSLKSNYLLSYMPLIRDGYVLAVKGGRKEVRGGIVQHMTTYTLGFTALAILEERVKCQKKADES